MTGFSTERVPRALGRLDVAQPPYIEGQRTAQAGYPIAIHGVTEHALRATCQWPDLEHWG